MLVSIYLHVYILIVIFFKNQVLFKAGILILAAI